MLFSKKTKEAKDVPIEEVQKMTKKGMSDKDIIKHLKSKGYSYESIESAMLKAVKENVDERPQMVQRMDMSPPASDNVYGFPGVPQEFSPDFMQPTPVEVPEDVDAPELMLEELVEGVVNDKWKKFDDRIRQVEEGFDKIRGEIKQFDVKLDQAKSTSPSRDLELKMGDISDRIEDMEARIGGLEKAFKQFLPSLTRNIESLSHMIHEMKEKQSLHEEEI